MRVMHIISCLVKTDGHSLFCMRLAERLHAQGHAQTIFTLPSGGGEISDPQGLVQHADGRLLRFLNVSLPFGIERQIAALALFFKPDVVHLHGGWHPVLFFGACVARRMGIPILLSLHGSLRPAVVEGDRRLKKRLAWRLYQRRLVQMSSIVHVSTETEKEDLARLGFHKPIAVVPNGVDREDFSRQGAKPQREAESEDGGQRTEDGERSAFVHDCERALVGKQEAIGNESTHARMNSRAHELPRDAARTRTVLYLGRLHPLKGLDLLVEAWARVKGSVSSKPLSVSGKPIKVSGKSGNVCGRTEVPKETDYDLRLTVNGASWQLIIAGPDEQGTLKALKEQAERLGLTVSRQLLTVNCEPAADGSRASDPDIRLTAYRSPLTDLVFMGPVYGERKALLLSQADLFVLPTRSDNFGIAVAEALASGVPVVCTKGAPWEELLGNEEMVSGKRLAVSGKPFSDDGENVSGKRLTVNSKSLTVSGGQCSETERIQPLTAHGLPFTDFTSNGRCGWWVDIGAEPLAAALREAMSLADEQRRAMGENGRRLVERKYRWETVAEQMGAVYRGIVNGKP